MNTSTKYLRHRLEFGPGCFYILWVNYVTITITGIDHETFPWFVSFHLVDVEGRIYHFVDKAPVVGLTTEQENINIFPFEILIGCTFFTTAATSAVIDTSIPYGIEARSGETRFNVSVAALRGLPSRQQRLKM